MYEWERVCAVLCNSSVHRRKEKGAKHLIDHLTQANNKINKQSSELNEKKTAKKKIIINYEKFINKSRQSSQKEKENKQPEQENERGTKEHTKTDANQYVQYIYVVHLSTAHVWLWRSACICFTFHLCYISLFILATFLMELFKASGRFLWIWYISGACVFYGWEFEWNVQRMNSFCP